jgi:hypothetical protein
LRFEFVRGRIFGSEEASRNFQRINFFAHANQFLFFSAEYFVWIFHLGEGLTFIDSRVIAVKNYSKRNAAKSEVPEVHLGRESSEVEWGRMAVDPLPNG